VRTHIYVLHLYCHFSWCL